MKLTINSRNGKAMAILDLEPICTVQHLKEQFKKATKGKWDVDRQYFTKGAGKDRVALKDNGKSIREYGIDKDCTLIFKDLGYQIGWRTVFFIEYLGPLLIHPFFYFFPQLIYGSSYDSYGKSYAQTCSMILVVLHYLKREFESLFVHRFSANTMPFTNVFKNSGHYWVLGGVFISYYLYHPHYTQFISDRSVNILSGLIIVCMIGNLYSHMLLRDLRPPGTTIRRIPKGFLFHWVSCPNYLFEIIEWILFAIMTQCLPSFVFMIVSSVQMWIWAVQKHQRYKKEFDGSNGERYPKRAILIPYLL